MGLIILGLVLGLFFCYYGCASWTDPKAHNAKCKNTLFKLFGKWMETYRSGLYGIRKRGKNGYQKLGLQNHQAVDMVVTYERS